MPRGREEAIPHCQSAAVLPNPSPLPCGGLIVGDDWGRAFRRLGGHSPANGRLAQKIRRGNGFLALRFCRSCHVISHEGRPSIDGQMGGWSAKKRMGKGQFGLKLDSRGIDWPAAFAHCYNLARKAIGELRILEIIGWAVSEELRVWGFGG